MLIEIHRYRIRGTYCDSTMYIDDQRVCNCAENALHRAPSGLYDIDLRFSREAHRKVPTLIPLDGCMQVAHGRFPIIRTGNGIHTLRHGQIIVGKLLVPGVVIHSYAAFHPLYDRINNTLRRGNSVRIQITE